MKNFISLKYILYTHSYYKYMKVYNTYAILQNACHSLVFVIKNIILPSPIYTNNTCVMCNISECYLLSYKTTQNIGIQLF